MDRPKCVPASNRVACAQASLCVSFQLRRRCQRASCLAFLFPSVSAEVGTSFLCNHHHHKLPRHPHFSRLAKSTLLDLQPHRRQQAAAASSAYTHPRSSPAMASLGPSALSMRSRTAGGASTSSAKLPSDAAPHRVSSLNAGVGGGKRFVSAQQQQQQQGHASAAPDLQRAEKLIVAGITLVACFVRLWKIGQPSSVV